MKNWWKNPVLQGEDNDYGQYDYLIEELPHDEVRWEWYYRKCDTCGKYHRLNFYSNYYFYTYDGWDSFDYADCADLRIRFGELRIKLKRKLKLISWRFL